MYKVPFIYKDEKIDILVYRYDFAADFIFPLIYSGHQYVADFCHTADSLGLRYEIHVAAVFLKVVLRFYFVIVYHDKIFMTELAGFNE